jgi:HEAT repeat protein
MKCMTICLLLALLAGVEARPAVQDSVDWKKTRELMHSPDWPTREKAFHILADLGCADAVATEAVFELLRIENEFIDNHVARKTAPGEAHGEYYGDLLGHAFSCFKQSPKPEWFRVLALGGYGSDSRFANELARHVDGNLSWLLAATTSKNEYTRANLYSLLVQSLAQNPAWPERDRSAVLAAIWRGLTDPDSFVRNTTAFVLSGSGLKEARGLLLKAKAELAKRPDMRPDLFDWDWAIERTAKTGIR